MSVLESISVTRPRRWDQPFSQESVDAGTMTERDVDSILQERPFSELDESGFRKSLPLRGILQNDARIVRCDVGDIVVRRGDWGQSAFFILSGSMRVEIERAGGELTLDILDRGPSRRRNLFESIAQLWTNSSAPECRDHRSTDAMRTDIRGSELEGRLYLQDVPAVLDEFRTAKIEPGHWFGELSALGRTARTATVFAEEPSVLLEIRWQGLRDLMRFDSQHVLADEVESAFRRNAFDEFLRNEPSFRSLSDSQLQELADGAEFHTFGQYDTPKPFKDLASEGSENGFAGESIIFEEGHYPNAMLLVRSGLARLSVKHRDGQRTVGYLNAGQSYGFEEISSALAQMQAIPYRCTVRAISFLSAILIPSPLIERVLLRTDERGETPTVPSAAKSDGCVADDLLTRLVGSRYVQGTAAMVIDLNRCVRCDDCVHACAAAHDNNPRFVRHGPVLGHHMLANACLQCSDPLCLVECPTGAIHRDAHDGQILINEQTCIGCAQCANNCDFDAIRMVPIRDRSGQLLIEEKTSLPVLQATKCDLCVSQLGGPACQNACGHDALERVDLRDIHELQRVFADD